eukprot:TRINITY_DN35_c0_g1_i1.p1 TRINITY_DN35_c0_g1~~TRINITY_DN35_c0_g1_i1.p1  ORF type:complete len:435 (-),score=84.34 TRINITY_DN35_c0_g1_i1:78-1382(-)
MTKAEEENRLLLGEEDFNHNHHHHHKLNKTTLEAIQTDSMANNPSLDNDKQFNTQNNDIKLNITTTTPTTTSPSDHANTTKKVVAVLFWILFSALTLILNKLLFSVLSFPYPITLTMVHTIVCSILSFLVICVFGWVPLVKQDRSIFFTQVVPLAIIFCVNIVIGNTALEYIHISFNQTIKSTVPVFTVFINVLFLNKKYQRLVYASLIPVVGGVAMASFAEVNFNIIGFLCSVVSSGTTALQLIFAGLLLEGGTMKKMDPINLLLYMAPTSFAILLPLSFASEWGGIHQHFAAHPEQIGKASLILLGSGVIAFLLNYSTFIVASLLSSLAMVVTGNIKAVTNIVISVLIFRNKMTVFNVFGCVVALGGAAWYQHVTSKKPPPAQTDDSNKNNNTKNASTTVLEGNQATSASESSPKNNHAGNDSKSDLLNEGK